MSDVRSAASAASGAPAELPRRLGLWSAIAVVVGITIGSGIFRTPASVTNRLPGPLPLFGVWIAGGIVALCGALTLAEVAGAFPETGGIFVFIRNAWGRLPAFLFGWAELAIIRAAALGAIATTFAEYLFRVLGFDPSLAPYDGWVHYVAALAIAVIAALNYAGVRWGSLLQNITTVAKYFGLLFIVIVAIAIGLPKTGGHFTPAFPAGSFSIAPFGLALVSVLWAYDGWADLAFISGEVKNPEKNLPRALILGTIAVVVVYMLANIAYLGVMSVDEIRHSKLVAADVAQRVVGPAGVTFVSITVMLSTLGTLNGSILTNPRVFFAMAADRLLFRKIAAVHPRYETPYVAITLAAVLGIIFVLMRTFEQLADTFVTAILPFYASGGCVDLRVPPACRLQAGVSCAALSVRADSLRAGDDLSARQRADRPEQPLADARGLRRHPARHSGVLPTVGRTPRAALESSRAPSPGD